ncbi:MAG TPA: MFS transporter [Anaerolineales bacterium]|nr:MFS transporter [Anaerolineales bacterium]
MINTFHRNGFTWLAYFLLAFYGSILNIIGPITPFLKEELGLSYTISSLHYTAFAVGMLMVGLGGHWVINRIGRRRALWLGALGLSAGALILIAGRNPWITIGASFTMGLVGSLILVIIPSALADQHGQLRAVAISEGNVIASIVSAFTPLLVGWTARLPGGWRISLALFALMPILLWLAFRKASPPETPQTQSASTIQKPISSSLPAAYWIYWAALVLAVSVEFCMISWSADYLEKHLGMIRANAALAVSAFLIGMILGRLAGSRLVQHFPIRKVVLASILVAGAGFLMYWIPNNLVLGLVGLFVTGLGVASLYPLIISLALGAAQENTVAASTRATLASGTAILALPLVLGRLADYIGIRSAYSVVLILLVSVFLIIRFTKDHRQ